MAFQFQLADSADQSRLTAVKSATASADLAPYTSAIGDLAKVVGSDGYSPWAKVSLPADAKRRSERRRFSTAAKVAGKHLAFHSESTDKVLWMRLRPAPTARKPRTPANGAVTTPAPAPVAPVANGRKPVAAGVAAS